MPIWQTNRNIKTNIGVDYESQPTQKVQQAVVPAPQAVVSPQSTTSDISKLFSISDLNIEKMTNELAPFVDVAKKLSMVHEGTAPMIIEKCADGLSRIAYYHAIALTKANLARSNRKATEADVVFSEFDSWAAASNQKSTDKNRDFFCLRHPKVLQAKKDEAEAEGLLSYLETIKQLFIMSLSSAKSIAYSHRSSDYTTGSNKTNF